MKGILSESDLRRIGTIVVSGYGDESPEMDEPCVVIDSRVIADGDVFVALCGERTDAHRYIDEVFSKGASWAVVSEDWYALHPIDPGMGRRRYLVVPDTVKGLQRLASAYRDTFAIPVVAVGGSNGKTTTKELVASVLATGFRVHMSKGNLNNHLGVPLTLLQIKRDTEIAVVEMGINHPGEMELLASIAKPTHGLLTNIGHEHLEFLRDLDGVADAETRLYEYLDSNGGICFVNTGDARLKKAAAGLRRTVLYGLDEFGEQVPHVEEIGLDEYGRATFFLCSGGKRHFVTLRLTGRHNVINALAAAAVGSYFGLALAAVREGLENLHPASGWKRMEYRKAGGVTIINDTYNANPDSVRYAIDLLDELSCPGRKIAVLGDMLELGNSGALEHDKIGRYIQRSTIDLLLTIGDLARGYVSGNEARAYGHYANREELSKALLDMVRPGDVVLFKGSRGMRLDEAANVLCDERVSQ
ncbi:MAG: UDP-N-acetylmuramoyl-tripeptide--D-alanyl-D-alanine ligase [Chlorobium sp.]|jgi:UDP-N-acetylmuramoyl-tripeptide--D-alanyl-D-alanine ligase|uniref:UDP-N-acetylmuramoyl-tripeptide--D-alanyl-D- alanine ligase n=1 Tax=Chlorobium sp. TaxID=1095 RepID=UPI001D5E09A7|nr:UDP-N-acetylmuramoyl-tripeptide--D-alanyl-D-alanine ligase [Chlorobium sp.]MBN1279030.1 UDP-N-acetylmuramoyl-tripeptide--D-alanyl-D-alanine ligase [Chlorobiaceae bacterium]MCF8216309.1 UDP-N-acetylmuramoyl-tripeptide--D-alanyl-D-alanine ligase [Chlorobium sp.]MCF8271211.1 UDP-N-acetylmuramoyl-tripeptide--D-alanyl-D-alanine ligase [Chlorobium sp.]MCF8287585.1 UDP-N-acetylmuramoyl-tripeptide--D-alanyl-D-alanine ligase [Chlorobium sp.]MCF8291124.1 UDP-N-acetylmuramoyl-tripeptide--D-alanyl-D-al